MDLALKVLDVGNLLATGLLMYRLTSMGASHFKNTCLSEGRGLETFIKELVEWYPATEDCIPWAFRCGIILKTVLAEMELVKSHTLLLSIRLPSLNAQLDYWDPLAPCTISFEHFPYECSLQLQS